MARIERDSLNYNLLFILSELISWTLTIYLFWLVFRVDGATFLSLPEWFGKYYPRSLLQYVGGFFLFFPFYTALRLIFGEEGLALQPGHTILMVSLSIWIFISINLGTLWLCFRNEGFLRNVKNSINDAFRNFGCYLFLRLIVLAFTYLSQVALSGFSTFNGLACGLLILISILMDMSWIALVFGFLGLRKREQLNLVPENRSG